MATTNNLSESYMARSMSPMTSVSVSSAQPLPTPSYHFAAPLSFLGNPNPNANTSYNNNSYTNNYPSTAASMSGRISYPIYVGSAPHNASTSNIFNTAHSFAYSQSQTPVNTSMAFSIGPSVHTQSPPTYSNFFSGTNPNNNSMTINPTPRTNTNNNNNNNNTANIATAYSSCQQIDGLGPYPNPSSLFVAPSIGTSAQTPPTLSPSQQSLQQVQVQVQVQQQQQQQQQQQPQQKQQSGGGVQDIPAALLLDNDDPTLSHAGPLGAATAASLVDLVDDVTHAAPIIKFAAMLRQKWHPNLEHDYPNVKSLVGAAATNTAVRPYDLFSVYYMQSLAEENRKREIELQLRNSATKVSSTFSFVRLEGLKELLQQMSELLTIATIESQEKRQELLLQEQLAEEEAARQYNNNNYNGTDALASRGIATALPYDAVRAEITGRGEDYPLYSPTWARTQQAALDMDYTSSVFHLILVPRAEVRAKIVMGTPVDVVLTEEEALAWCPTHTAAVTPANLPYIPLAQQQQLQQQRAATAAAAAAADGAADGSDGSSYEENGEEAAPKDSAASPAAAPSVAASPSSPAGLDGNKTAHASSLSIGLGRGAPAAAAAGASPSPTRKRKKDGSGGAGGAGDGKGASELPPPPARSIYEVFTLVTTEEQELAFRVLQGLCLCYNYQRRCIGESALVHYATEILQCYLQHRAAWYHKRRREQTGRMLEELRPRLAALWSSPSASAGTSKTSRRTSTGVPAEPERGDRSGRRARAAEKEKDSNADSATHTAEEDALAAVAAAADELAEATDDEVELLLRALREHCASLEESEQQLRQVLDQLPVTQPEDPSVERMLVALIDCLEAACHYNPVCLTRWVQTGGVRALLDLIYPPYIPTRLRVAVLETISILLQEVAPFRRMVQPAAAAAGSPSAEMGEGGRAPHPAPEPHHPGEVDGLLPLMLRQANSGNYGAAASGPPPYWMDRASASKFENAAKEWFSRKGLSHVVTNIMQLKKTKRMGEAEVAVEGRDRQRMRQLAEIRVSELLQAIDRVAASADS